jgi:hypothetical protein
MSLALPFRLPSSRKTQVICVAIALLAAAAVISSSHRKPRAWRVDEVPIAFWAWRNQAPSEADVRNAMEKTGARTIFLRAGQIDYQDGKLRRIRPVTGPLPKGIDLHLVYNATRSLLAQLETVDGNALADSIASAFQEDAERAAREQAQVVGLQIDIDVPTRLLGRYEKTLRALRAHLKPGTQLSITGLPTWMQSAALPLTLAQVDFWIPQFYGAEIPERSDQFIPISSPKDTERFVNSARQLNKPFYAGLAAYSCALLYSASGSLISLRGDMDAAVISSDPNLELIDQRSFEVSAQASEWRFAYRARAAGVTDGLAMHAGDVLVVEMPSAESLRAAARIVREQAGEKLLGICVFRLPARDDPATLAVQQVVAALSDSDSFPDIKVRFKGDDDSQAHAWFVEVENRGAASAVGGLQIDVPVDAGTIQSVTPERGASFETICHVRDANDSLVYEPCSQARANLIRITSPGLRSGQTLKAMIVFTNSLPDVVPVSIDTQTDAGQPYHDLEVVIKGGVKRCGMD